MTERRILRFILVGAVNSLLHYCVFLVLLHGVGVPLLWSSVVGYACGVINSYFMNRRWTFRASRPGNLPEFIRFVVVNAGSLAVNLVLLSLLVEPVNLAPAVAQVIAVGASAAVNFEANRRWTFS